MGIYQEFLIRGTDCFNTTAFPLLKNARETIAVEFNQETVGPKADMLVSFVKEHAITSTCVLRHASVASLISTKSISLGILEEMFE